MLPESPIVYLRRGSYAAQPAAPRHPLVERAAALWPNSPRNQREWLRAVRVVRATGGGWLLDRPQTKLN